jgi:hypothetical protein
MHIHSKSFFWAAVCAACLCFFLWLNSIKYVEAKRDINVVNRAHLRAITLLLDLYRENHSGNLPKSLDDLKPLIDDYRVFIWRNSFEDKGVPWVYLSTHPDGILIVSPQAANGTILKLTDQGKIIELAE